MSGGTGTIEEKVITPSYRKTWTYILTITAGLYLWGVLINATYHSYRYTESLIESRRVEVYTPEERERWEANSEKVLNELLSPRVLVPLSAFIGNPYNNMEITDLLNKKKSTKN